MFPTDTTETSNLSIGTYGFHVELHNMNVMTFHACCEIKSKTKQSNKIKP